MGKLTELGEVKQGNRDLNAVTEDVDNYILIAVQNMTEDNATVTVQLDGFRNEGDLGKLADILITLGAELGH